MWNLSFWTVHQTLLQTVETIAGLKENIMKADIYSPFLFQRLKIQMENVNDEYPEYVDLTSIMLTISKHYICI